MVLYAYFIFAPRNTTACQVLASIPVYPTMYQCTARARSIPADELQTATQGTKQPPERETAIYLSSLAVQRVQFPQYII